MNEVIPRFIFCFFMSLYETESRNNCVVARARRKVQDGHIRASRSIYVTMLTSFEAIRK